MVLVQDELPAVDPGAEREVSSDDRKDAGDNAGDDGADVGTALAIGVGLAIAAARRGGRGDDGAVGGRYGVGDGFARGERPVGGGLDGGGQGCAAGGVAADDALHGGGDGVAVGALETGGRVEAALVALLAERVGAAVLVAAPGLRRGRARERCELVRPFE